MQNYSKLKASLIAFYMTFLWTKWILGTIGVLLTRVSLHHINKIKLFTFSHHKNNIHFMVHFLIVYSLLCVCIFFKMLLHFFSAFWRLFSYLIFVYFKFCKNASGGSSWCAWIHEPPQKNVKHILTS